LERTASSLSKPCPKRVHHRLCGHRQRHTTHRNRHHIPRATTTHKFKNLGSGRPPCWISWIPGLPSGLTQNKRDCIVIRISTRPPGEISRRWLRSRPCACCIRLRSQTRETDGIRLPPHSHPKHLDIFKGSPLRLPKPPLGFVPSACVLVSPLYINRLCLLHTTAVVNKRIVIRTSVRPTGESSRR